MATYRNFYNSGRVQDCDSDSEPDLVIDEDAIVYTRNQDDKINLQSYVRYKELISDMEFGPIPQGTVPQDESYICSICQQSFKYNVALIFHLDAEHGGRGKDKNVDEKKRKKNDNVRSRKISKTEIIETSKLEMNYEVPQVIQNVRENGENYPLDLSMKTVKDCASQMMSILDMFTTRHVTAKGETMVCRKCKKCFPKDSKLERLTKHTEACSMLQFKYKCQLCKPVVKFQWALKLRTHMFKKHKKTGFFICDYCQEISYDFVNHQHHTSVCKQKDSNLV